MYKVKRVLRGIGRTVASASGVSLVIWFIFGIIKGGQDLPYAGWFTVSCIGIVVGLLFQLLAYNLKGICSITMPDGGRVRDGIKNIITNSWEWLTGG